MVNMRTVLFILFLISASRAEVNVTSRCSNSSGTSLTFKPSEDNVNGRYKVEWCLQAKKNVTVWELTLEYNDYLEQSKCQNVGDDCKTNTHSYFYTSVTNNLNCAQVCLSTFLDLMFNACYFIQTFLYINSTVSSRYNNLHYIANNFTKEYFTNSLTVVSPPLYEDGNVVINWYLGNVPATEISMGIIEDKDKDNYYKVSYTVSGVQRNEVTSWAVVPPRCYRAYLKHHAPWTSCTIFESIGHIEYKFCQPAPGVAEASSSPEGALRALAGVAAAVVVIALVLFAVWRHRPASWQRRVRDHWLKASSARNPPPQPPCVDGTILLLYARDCASFVRVAERLAVLVRSVTGCRVIDVYNGESMRLWAPAGDEWLRLLMSREETRVLLLQSPAGALLAAELSETSAGPALSAPLLGSRVMWRRPHAGDSLLSLALRLMSAAPSPTPYTKYYVAGIGGLGSEMAPGVTPQRRYTLPEAVLCLLRDLAPGINLAPGLDLAPGCDLTPGLNSALGLDSTPGLDSAPGLEHIKLEPLLRQFKETADAFADHVREHPDYLADELLFT